MRRAFALASLATLIVAVALHVFNQEAVAEIIADIAYFAAVTAVLVPLSKKDGG